MSDRPHGTDHAHEDPTPPDVPVDLGDPTEHRVQDLGEFALHARALACGEHDDGERTDGIGGGHGNLLGESSWGGRIRTSDHGTKTRCLTTWLRPIGARSILQRTVVVQRDQVVPTTYR